MIFGEGNQPRQPVAQRLDVGAQVAFDSRARRWRHVPTDRTVPLAPVLPAHAQVRDLLLADAAPEHPRQLVKRHRHQAVAVAQDGAAENLQRTDRAARHPHRRLGQALVAPAPIEQPEHIEAPARVRPGGPALRQ